MKLANFSKTLLSVSIFSAVSLLVAYQIQSKANASVRSCSYLDPVTVGICALILGFFLVSEGSLDIFNHRDSHWRQQMSRCLRISVGVAMVTIHVMQFAYKG